MKKLLSSLLSHQIFFLIVLCFNTTLFSIEKNEENKQEAIQDFYDQDQARESSALEDVECLLWENNNNRLIKDHRYTPLDIKNSIEDMKDSTHYIKARGSVPTDMLLQGFSIADKAVIAHAIAGETKKNYYSISIPHIIDKYTNLACAKINYIFDYIHDTHEPALFFLENCDVYTNSQASFYKEILLILYHQLREKNPNIFIIVGAQGDTLHFPLNSTYSWSFKECLELPNGIHRKAIISHALSTPVLDTQVLGIQNKNYSNAITEGFLKKLVKLTDRLGAQDIKNIIYRACLHASQRGEDIIQEDDILKAFYSDQRLAPTIALATEILSYFITIYNNQEDIQEGIHENNIDIRLIQALAADSCGLSAYDLKQIVSRAHSISDGGIITFSHLTVAFYTYNNNLIDRPIDDREIRSEFIRYYIEKEDLDLTDDFLNNLAEDLASCKAGEIKVGVAASLIKCSNNKRNNTLSQNNSNAEFQDRAPQENMLEHIQDQSNYAVIKSSFKFKNPSIRIDSLGGKIPADIMLIVNKLHAFEQGYKSGLMQALRPHVFYGEPGSGKSTLAEAIAGETGRLFIRVSTAEMVGSYINHGADSVRALFDAAREQSQPVVICIDEIDSLVNMKCQDNNGEYLKTRAAFNQQLDRKDLNILLIGTTNNYDSFSDALKSRFTAIKVDLPDYDQRVKILNHILSTRPHTLFPGDIAYYAQCTKNWNIRNLEDLIELAGVLTLQNNNQFRCHSSSKYIRKSDMDTSLKTTKNALKKTGFAWVFSRDPQLLLDNTYKFSQIFNTGMSILRVVFETAYYFNRASSIIENKSIISENFKEN